MKIYSYSEARQRLGELLERAHLEGSVRIRRRNGQIFVVQPEPSADSPLDVGGLDLGLTRNEIVRLVREGRRKA
jgi:prevent-host-death family protein